MIRQLVTTQASHAYKRDHKVSSLCHGTSQPPHSGYGRNNSYKHEPHQPRRSFTSNSRFETRHMSKGFQEGLFFYYDIPAIISAWIKDLLHILRSSHQSRVKPAAAPRRGVRAIDPLPTTLPVTIMLGPIYLRRCRRD